MPDLWLPTTPRPKPDEPISYEDWTRREALYDRVAERMAEAVKEAKEKRDGE